MLITTHPHQSHLQTYMLSSLFSLNPLIIFRLDADSRTDTPHILLCKLLPWVNIFSEQGAEASSVLYSIAETAKANNLRVYDYLGYTLDQLVKHADDTDRNFLNDLLP